MHKKITCLLQRRMGIPNEINFTFRDHCVFTKTGELIKKLPEFDLCEYMMQADTIKVSDIYFESFFESEYSWVVIPLCKQRVQLFMINSIKAFLDRYIRRLNNSPDKRLIDASEIFLNRCHRLQYFYGEEVQVVTDFIYEHFKNWDGNILQKSVSIKLNIGLEKTYRLDIYF